MSKKKLKILTTYKERLAWDYREMSELDRKLVEHKLPIKHGLGLFNSF